MALDASIILAGANNGRIDAAPLTNALLQYGQQKRQDELRPLQNQLLETQIAGAKQTQAGNDRELQLKAAQFQNQAFRALKSIPDPQLRQMAYQSFVEHGKQIGVHDGNPDDDISDNGLEAGIKATDAFMPKQQMTNASVKIAPTQTGYDVIDPYTGMPVRSVSGVKPTIEQKAAVDVSAYGQKRDIEAKTAPIIAAGTAEAVNAVNLVGKPKIQEAVKMAETRAKDRGETLTSLDRANAAMPGLIETVGQLKQLAPLATSTYSGRLFDAAVKESGFGATDGATARTKFVAIVNNQVLPLLRDTFGAAFTEKEGETLKATMGDPNASPQEKIAQLDAFIAQKQRDIETKQREVGKSQSAPAQQQGGGATNAKGWTLHQDAHGNKAYVGPNGEIEEVQ